MGLFPKAGRPNGSTEDPNDCSPCQASSAAPHWPGTWPARSRHPLMLDDAHVAGWRQGDPAWRRGECRGVEDALSLPGLGGKLSKRNRRRPTRPVAGDPAGHVVDDDKHKRWPSPGVRRSAGVALEQQQHHYEQLHKHGQRQQHQQRVGHDGSVLSSVIRPTAGRPERACSRGGASLVVVPRRPPGPGADRPGEPRPLSLPSVVRASPIPRLRSGWRP